MVMELDVKCIIQSHLKKIRVLKPEVMSPFYLFNAKIVQRQIEMLTFIQATLSTLGNRMTDVYLPIHKDKAKIAEIAEEVQSIIKVKKDIKFRANQLIENSL